MRARATSSSPLTLVLFLVGVCIPLCADDQVSVVPNKATGPGVTVAVSDVVKTRLPGGREAYSIRFEYAFTQLAVVHIRGLGEVPSKGAFSYITSESSLLFSDPSSKPIVNVPLQETLIVAAATPLTELPTEFPSNFKIYDWDAGKSFQSNAYPVLNKYFQVSPYEVGKIQYIPTTFTPVPVAGLPRGVNGQVALQFSFPYDQATKSYSLH